MVGGAVMPFMLVVYFVLHCIHVSQCKEVYGKILKSSSLFLSYIDCLTPLNILMYQAMARYARREVSCLSLTGSVPFFNLLNVYHFKLLGINICWYIKSKVQEYMQILELAQVVDALHLQCKQGRIPFL